MVLDILYIILHIENREHDSLFGYCTQQCSHVHVDNSRYDWECPAGVTLAKTSVVPTDEISVKKALAHVDNGVFVNQSSY